MASFKTDPTATTSDSSAEPRVRRSSRIREAPADDVLPTQKDLMGSFRYRSAATVRAADEQAAPEPSEFLEVTWTPRMEQPLAIVTNMPMAPKAGPSPQFMHHSHSSSGASTSSTSGGSGSNQLPLRPPSSEPSRGTVHHSSSSSDDASSSDSGINKAEKARRAGNPHFAYTATSGAAHYNAVGPLPHNAHLNYVTLANMAPWIGSGPPRSRSNSPPEVHGSADGTASQTHAKAAANGNTNGPVTQQMLGKAFDAGMRMQQLHHHQLLQQNHQHQPQHYGPWPEPAVHHRRTISPPTAQQGIRRVEAPASGGVTRTVSPSGMHDGHMEPRRATRTISPPGSGGIGFAPQHHSAYAGGAAHALVPGALPGVASLLVAPHGTIRRTISPPGSTSKSNGHMGNGLLGVPAWPPFSAHSGPTGRNISPPSTPNIFAQPGVPSLYVQQGGKMPVVPQQPYAPYPGAYAAHSADMTLASMQMQHFVSHRRPSLSADEQQVALTMSRFSEPVSRQ